MSKIMLIDGGTGTELERRGVPMVEKAWSSMATLTHPKVLQQIHEDYIRAGAEVIITNTFSTSRHLLKGEGIEEHFEALNKTAVSVALAARNNVPTEKPVLIAGSISSAQMDGALPSEAEARKNYADQVKILLDGGVDMFALEMMRDVTHTQIILDEVYKTGLPVWVGFSCKIVDGEVEMAVNDNLLKEALPAFKDQPIDMLVLMHTLTEDIDACLDVVDQHWDGKVGVYAHSGHFIMPIWQFIDVITPEDYADNCQRWMARGVEVIGGCCGIGPEHIEELKRRL